MQLALSTFPHALAPSGATVALAPRDAALLVWLALEGPTPRNRLAQLLWPESSAVAARNTLRQRLFKLRKLLGEDFIVGSTTLALAEGVSHDLHESDSVLGELTQDYGGELATWLGQQRERRLARRHQALAARCGQAEAAHHWAAALALARELLAQAPLSEAAHRRLMRLHYLSGDRAAALLAFDHCEQLLKDEVGAAPSAETLALLGTIERAATEAAWAPAVAVPAAVLRPPRLIGRDCEREQLASAVREGRVALLQGEAGMGKSRLLAELVRAPGGAWISVCARPGDAGWQGALLARLLRALLAWPGMHTDAQQQAELARVLPEMAPGPQPARDTDNTRLLAVLDALWAQAVAQGLRSVAVDDLQYADNASLALLQPLLDSGHCGWVLAMRPGELGAVAQALVAAHAQSGQALRVALQPLGNTAIAALLDSLALPGLDGAEQAQALHQHTGGNPLFLLETLKATWQQRAGALTTVGHHAGAIHWPRADNLLRLIQQRLARLGPLAQQLVRCAAVAGQDMSAPLAAQVLGLRPLDLADAWLELEAAQVLRDSGFAHDLIAEAALATVPQAIARLLHAEVAGWLAQAQGPAARIAEHWLAAGRAHQAAPHLQVAAQRAADTWQMEEAARLHEHAGQIWREAGDRRAAFQAYLDAADALTKVVMDTRAEAYEQALRELADDDGQRAMTAILTATILAEHHDTNAAHQVLLNALPLAEQAGLPEVEVELLWTLTVLHWDRRELPEARRCAERALARLDAVSPDTARLRLAGMHLKLTHALGRFLTVTGHYRQGDAKLAEAQRLAMASRDWSEACSLAGFLSGSALEQGELASARAWGEQVIDISARRQVHPNGLAMALTHHSRALATAGELGPALATAEQAAALCQQHANRHRVQVLRHLHGLQAELGRRDLALKGLHALVAHGDALNPTERSLLNASLLNLGEPADSAALLEGSAALDDFALRAQLLCLAQPGCEPLQILPLLRISAAAARDQGAHGLWLGLQTHQVAALRAAGRLADAAELALALWPRLGAGLVGAVWFPRVAAELCAALAPSHADLVQVMALQASAWMQRAASTLPPAWRGNYLARAPLLQTMPPTARGLLLVAGR